MLLVTYILISLAASMSAIMDRTENLVAFNRSVFNHLSPKFWCKEISWQYSKKIFRYKLDAWHLAKSTMIVSGVCAAVFGESSGNWMLDIVIAGVIWNVVFNLFYHKILYR
jgi:hypothetical protein